MTPLELVVAALVALVVWHWLRPVLVVAVPLALVAGSTAAVKALLMWMVR